MLVGEVVDDGTLSLIAATVETEVVNPGDPNGESIPEEYQVRLPIFEVVIGKDGGEIPVVRQKVESRVRSVRPKSEWKSNQIECRIAIAISECSFQSTDGSDLSVDSVLTRLKDRLPVLVLRVGEKLHPWFRELAKPDTIVVITDQILPGHSN